MALVTLSPPMPALFPALGSTHTSGTLPAFTSNTIDAVGEYVDFIGQVYWENGATGKTIDTTGSSAIVWRTGGTVTWTTAGTVRVGIQSLNGTTGNPPRGDGSYRCYRDYVQGVDTLAANTTYTSTPITADGSNTYNTGDIIAVRIEMTARSGTPSVQVASKAGSTRAAFPCVVANTGAVAVVAGIPNVMLRASDGTIGWLAYSGFFNTLTTRNFDSGTGTADEYGNTFVFPYEITVCGVQARFRVNVVTGASCNFILYTDPLGTPVAAESYNVDQQFQLGNTTAASDGLHTIIFDTPVTIAANTKFALTIQPTDTNSDIEFIEHDFTSFSAAGKAVYPFNSTVKKATRLDATGALTETDNVVEPIWPLLSAVDITTGGGGGLAANPIRGFVS